MRSRLRALLPRGGRTLATLKIVLGTAVGQAIALAAAPVLSRRYTPEQFGLYAAYLAVVGLLTPVSALRYDLAIPLAKSRGAAARLTVLALCAVFGVGASTGVLIALAGWSGAKAGVLGLLAPIPVVVSLGLIFNASMLVLGAWALRGQSYSNFARSRPTQSVVAAGCQVAATGGHAAALPAGHAIGGFVGAAQLLLGESDRRLLRRVRLRELGRAAARFRRYPLLGLPSAVLNSVGLQIQVLVMASAFPAGVLGQLSLGQRIVAGPITLLGTSIGQVFFAEGAKTLRQSHTEFIGMYQRVLIKLLAMAFGLGGILFLFGPQLVLWVFGPQWRMGGEFVRWMAPALALQFVAAPLAQVLNLANRLGLQLWWDTIRLGITGVVLLLAVRTQDPMFAVKAYSATLTLLYFGLVAIYTRVVWRVRGDDSLR